MTPPSAAPRLSATLIVRNEEDRLAACLASLSGLVDEIVVVDTGSTDRTVAMAEAAGATVHHRRLDGFGPTKQFALACARGDWVLSVDADERVTPALAAEIRRVVSAAETADGYEILRHTSFLGGRLRFGGAQSDRVLRLFRRERGRFTDAAVHERVEVLGRVGRLSGPLEHDTIRSMAELLEKIERYADLRAKEMARLGRRYRWWDVLRLPVNFVVYLIVKLALLDGVRGVIWAAGAAYHSWRKYDLLRPRPAAGPPAR